MDTAGAALAVARVVLGKIRELRKCNENCKKLAVQAETCVPILEHLSTSITPEQLADDQLARALDMTNEALEDAQSYVEDVLKQEGDLWHPFLWATFHAKQMLMGRNAFLETSWKMEVGLSMLNLAVSSATYTHVVRLWDRQLDRDREDAEFEQARLRIMQERDVRQAERDKALFDELQRLRNIIQANNALGQMPTAPARPAPQQQRYSSGGSAAQANQQNIGKCGWDNSYMREIGKALEIDLGPAVLDDDLNALSLADAFDNVEEFGKPTPRYLPDLKVTGWSCDGCLRDGEVVRFRCDECVDFNLCGVCYNVNMQPLAHSIFHAMSWNVDKTAGEAESIRLFMDKGRHTLAALNALQDALKHIGGPITPASFSQTSHRLRTQSLQKRPSVYNYPSFVLRLLNNKTKLRTQQAEHVMLLGANDVWGWLSTMDFSNGEVGQPLIMHAFDPALIPTGTTVAELNAALTVLPQPNPRMISHRSLHKIDVFEADIKKTTPLVVVVSPDLIVGTLGGLVPPHKLPENMAVPVLLQVADALKFAHRTGCVHGQLSPHNIFLRHVPPVSKALATKDVVLTSVCVSYFHLALPAAKMAPIREAPEMRSGALTPATDVYLWAALAVSLLPKTYSAELAELIELCLRENPHDRPADGTELVSRLCTLSIVKPLLKAVGGALSLWMLSDGWFAAPPTVELRPMNRSEMRFSSVAEAVAYGTNDFLEPVDSVSRHVLSSKNTQLCARLRAISANRFAARDIRFTAAAILTEPFEHRSGYLKAIIHVAALPLDFFKQKNAANYNKDDLMQFIANAVCTACMTASNQRFRSLDLFVVAANMQGMQYFLLQRDVRSRLDLILFEVYSSAESVRDTYMTEINRQKEFVRHDLRATTDIAAGDGPITVFVSSSGTASSNSGKRLVATAGRKITDGVVGTTVVENRFLLAIDSVQIGTAPGHVEPLKRFSATRTAVLEALNGKASTLEICLGVATPRWQRTFVDTAAVVRSVAAAVTSLWPRIVARPLKIVLLLAKPEEHVEFGDEGHVTVRSSADVIDLFRFCVPHHQA